MGNGFFINRSLVDYETDPFMRRLNHLLNNRDVQNQIANIWRKTRSKEKYQQERPLSSSSIARMNSEKFQNLHFQAKIVIFDEKTQKL